MAKSFGLCVIGLLLATAVGAWQTTTTADLKRRLSDDEFTLVACMCNSTLGYFLHILLTIWSAHVACVIVSLILSWAVLNPNDDANEVLMSELETVHQSGMPTVIVNCTSGSVAEFCQEKEVISYPTIRLYNRDAPPISYRGARKAASIISFMGRIRRPVVTSIKSNTVTSFSSMDDIVLIASLQESDHSPKAIFSELAEKYHDRYSFGTVTSSSGQSQLHCYNNNDKFQHSMTDLDQIERYTELLTSCTQPLIPELSRNIMPTITDTRKYSLLVYYCSDDAEARESYTAIMNPVAQRHKNVKFVTVNTELESNANVPSSLGLTGINGLAVWDLFQRVSHPYLGEIKPSHVEAFVRSIEDGDAEPQEGKHAGGDEHDEL